ncbi:MAG TPA: hypothetical protein VHR45_17375 [Thermoanaerobaculia bacterium]|nr:hypothetical protein [Thermoanaerobaculia bacterium]
MTYPGNPSLPPDVQQRIRSTFAHTLGLAEKGSRQEALLGCDFVLRMDPQFEPARRLQERLDANDGTVRVEDLRALASGLAGGAGAGEAAGIAGAAARPEPHANPGSSPQLAGDLEPLFTDLGGLAPELPELPELPPLTLPDELGPSPGDPGGPLGPLTSPPSGTRQAQEPAPRVAGGVGALRAEFEQLLGARRFQELLARAGSEAAAVENDLELQRLVALGQERLEAGPYVNKFVTSARDAMRAGKTAEAARLLDKASTLDPTHPGLAEVAGGARSQREPELRTQAIPNLGKSGGGPPPREAPPVASTPAGPAAPDFGPPSSRPWAIPTPAQAVQPLPPGVPSPATAGPGIAGGFGRQASVPAAPTAAAAMLGSTGDSESERRIQQLLEEGQAALDAGDPQAAIDAWSRIFLIDIDHHEAAQRIEQARRLKAERERQVEETFHDGLARLERRDGPGAREAFAKVLEIQPGHLQSREYLQQLDAGIMPAPSAPAASAASRERSTAAPTRRQLAEPAAPVGMVRGTAADEPLQEEILVPPDPDPESAKAGARAAEPRREPRAAAGKSRREGRARRLFLLVGSAVLLLVVAVAWYVYQRQDQVFPNSRAEETATQPAPNPILRAKKLRAAGKGPIAIAQLRRIPPSDPMYKEAQTLIFEWEALGGQAPAAATGEPAAAGPAATQAGAVVPAQNPPGEKRRQLVEAADRAYREHSYLLAAEKYEAANKLAALGPQDGAASAQFADAKQRLAPLARQIALFRDHEWELALPDLWRLHESAPANHDVTQMIVDSYYDLGVRDLQHSDTSRAAQEFTEALKLSPDDPLLKRQLLFAQTYQERYPDLLYRIYVKYLALR